MAAMSARPAAANEGRTAFMTRPCERMRSASRQNLVNNPSLAARREPANGGPCARRLSGPPGALLATFPPSPFAPDLPVEIAAPSQARSWGHLLGDDPSPTLKMAVSGGTATREMGTPEGERRGRSKASRLRLSKQDRSETTGG